MKVLKSVMMMAFLLVATSVVNSQAKGDNSAEDSTVKTEIEDFFIGTWKLDVYGLPQGDAVMTMVVEKKEGKLSGWLGGENGEEPNEFTKIEIEKETLYVRFLGGGWDVPMYLDKDGDDAVIGSMNDMFDVEGKKKVEKE
ncbi:hypothetical protein [Plebeiibacterium marinum]|uniref:Uncharacterized protein n=1 Tax=Plebeiibacterium marinum TaxID=2992111 RepID=A0AAE3SLC4_9BACT|nr:hypothetical protein [Plebeiobacterium marinum]MCW3807740.1 hypothetical protein [Plebeiobacterium marinum]